MSFRVYLSPALLGASVGIGVLLAGPGGRAQEKGNATRPNIPKAWDAKALQKMELPLVGLDKPVTHASLDYYNRVPVLTIQKGYPVYHPSKEPKGYLDALRQKEPESVPFDPTQFRTAADWIKAGELVFLAPDTGRGPSVADVHDPDWYKGLDVPVAADATLPGFRYMIRKKGEVAIEGANCARCHARVHRDGPLAGTVITGAPSNFPVSGRFAQDVRARAKEQGEQAGLALARLAVPGPRMPWNPKPGRQHDRLKLDDFITALEGTPPGLAFRIGTGVVYVPKIPDLIGIKDRKYLDATGLVRHRSPGDLMRYAALIGGRMSGMERHMSYGDWRPFGDLPDPKSKLRYSDEQLYALAQYIYSLKPPPNPNKMNDLAKRGQELFKRERCARCHSGDAYGGSTLTPVNGFKIPDEHPAADDIYEKSVGTDSNLALNTRKGTGFYRVPSLRGVWYRGLFEHNGSIAALEHWFDPRRLKDDYMPTGWKGPPGTKTRAVKGHPFGLDLPAEDRRALIAFLRTL
jgi:cytochrome c553